MPRNAKRGKRKDTAKRKKWRKSVKRHARNVPQQQQPLQQRFLQQPQVRNSTITFDQYVIIQAFLNFRGFDFRDF